MRTRIALASAAAAASIIAGNTANAVPRSPARTTAPAARLVRATAPFPRPRAGHARVVTPHPLTAANALDAGLSIGPVAGALGLDLFAPLGTRTTSATSPVPPPLPRPVPAVAPPPVPVTDSTSTNTADWACIRVHESGDRYNSASAPSGAYGIIEITWESFGHYGWPYEAPAAEQDALALELYHLYGWAPWSSRWACGL